MAWRPWLPVDAGLGIGSCGGEGPMAPERMADTRSASVDWMEVTVDSR